MGYFYYVVSSWPESQKNKDSEFSLFPRIKKNINFFFDGLQFYMTEYKTVLLIICVFLGLYFQKYVLSLYFTVLVLLSFFYSIELPQFFSDKIATLQQDFETLKIHKKTDFKLVTQCLDVTWLTLTVTFLLGPLVKSSGISDVIYLVNGVLWCFVFEAALLVNLIIEIYIIMYANTPVVEKVVVLCVRCVGSAIAAGGLHQFGC
jgi:hypothetical protein